MTTIYDFDGTIIHLKVNLEPVREEIEHKTGIKPRKIIEDTPPIYHEFLRSLMDQAEYHAADSSTIAPYAEEYANQSFRIIVSNNCRVAINKALDRHAIPRPDILICRDDPEVWGTLKPNPIYWKLLNDKTVFEPSVMVGDSWRDKQFAKNHNLKFIPVKTQNPRP